ncbi:hypothetical protein FACS1894132_08800 [Clostridia bacterium]|nr:hypothetical protein FACS1894132_08800 [Clostridia bacterium]
MFTEKEWNGRKELFVKIKNELLKWGFSSHSSREILVLFDRKMNIAKLYPMKDILKLLAGEVKRTKGGFNTGEFVSFQRKGGNGSLSKTIPKNSIKHPGNNIQLKLKINDKLIDFLRKILIAEYKIK